MLSLSVRVGGFRGIHYQVSDMECLLREHGTDVDRVRCAVDLCSVLLALSLAARLGLRAVVACCQLSQKFTQHYETGKQGSPSVSQKPCRRC